MSSEDPFKPIIYKISKNQPLTISDADTAFSLIMSGSVSNSQIGAFLMGLSLTGETSDIIASGANMLRQNAIKINSDDETIDTVGTGGDGAHTLNISSAAAFVVAGTGIKVAKHGSRSLSSKSGAADVLSELGINLDCSFNIVQKALDDNGICNRPRMITNLPAGKAFVLPREGSMNGTIFIDGTWESTLLEEPLELTVENGIVIDIKGDSTAAQIRQQFGEAASRLRSKDREMVWTVAEFGFGMNPNARMTGHVLEDEKQLGTCYFSIGDNSSLGGNAAVGIHIPGVISKPSVWLDDTQILDDGVFIA